MRVGMEATGYSRWFERLLAELGLRTVDRRSREDQGQANQEAEESDRNDARLLLRLMGKITSRKSGYRDRRIEICGNCCVAPASVGADAHADHESTAGTGDERGLSLEEKTCLANKVENS